MFGNVALQLLPKTTICQQLFLDSEGYIIESDDKIFNAFRFKEKSVCDWLPFFESIFPLLESLTLHDHEIRFEKVFPDTGPLKGFYEFAFIKVELDSKIITVWSIYDVTAICIEQGIRQQQINEQLLRNEYEK